MVVFDSMFTRVGGGHIGQKNRKNNVLSLSRKVKLVFEMRAFVIISFSLVFSNHETNEASYFVVYNMERMSC